MAASSSKLNIPRDVYGQQMLPFDVNDPYAEHRERIVPGACAPSHDHPVPPQDPKPAKKRVRKVVAHPSQLVLDLIVRLVEPIISKSSVPKQYRSAARADKQASRPAASDEMEVDDEVCEGRDSDIPFEKWGEVWVETRGGLTWSREGIFFLQVQLFWDSLVELTLKNNESEKWDVLKWIFKPAIRGFYYYGLPKVEWHEHDEPFSFHNCCNAVRVRADVIRDTLRKRTDPEIMKAIDKVYQNY